MQCVIYTANIPSVKCTIINVALLSSLTHNIIEVISVTACRAEIFRCITIVRVHWLMDIAQVKREHQSWHLHLHCYLGLRQGDCSYIIVSEAETDGSGEYHKQAF
jgi:hypothetical protein